MRIVRHSGTLAAPREQTFSLLEDARVAGRLNPAFLELEVLAAPWLPRAGERTRLRLRHRRVDFEMETELAEYRRGHFLLDRQVSGPFASFEHAIHVEDTAEDTIRVTEILAYAVPFGILGRLFDRFVLKVDLERILATRLSRLGDLLERGQSD